MSAHNIVVLRGTLTADARTRELPSGTVLTQFDLTTRDGGGTRSVPVAWFDPPGTSPLARGVELVVVGSVRRRFFRAGGATSSRTEVVADTVVAVRRRRAVERAVAACQVVVADLGAHEGVGTAADAPPGAGEGLRPVTRRGARTRSAASA